MKFFPRVGFASLVIPVGLGIALSLVFEAAPVGAVSDPKPEGSANARPIDVSAYVPDSLLGVIPRVDEAPGSVTVAGVVVMEGMAPVRGANISINLLMPNAAKEYRRKPLAVGSSDVNGGFAINVPLDDYLKSLATLNGGWLNFEALVFTGLVPCEEYDPGLTWVDCWEANTIGVPGSEASSAYWVATALASPVTGPVGAGAGLVEDAVKPVLLVLSEVQGTALDPADPIFGVDTPGLVTDVPGNINTSAPSCGTVEETLLDERVRPIVVGEFHLGEDMFGKFKYGRAADSELGVGYSNSSSGNEWELRGEVRVGTDNGAAVEWAENGSFSHHLTSDFNYRKELVKTYCASSYYYNTYEYRRIYADEWVGGTGVGADVSVWSGAAAFENARLCAKCYASVRPGGAHHRNTNRAYKYGWEIVVFGLRLSALSGYSTRVEALWRMGSDRSHYYLWGNAGTPPTTSEIIYAY